MTTETTAGGATMPETTQETPQGPADPPETTGGDDGAQDGEPTAREAARYRRRLREAEAERDALTSRLETMQKAEAERIAAGTVTNPAALWAAGTTLADVLTDDGTVDPEKVRAATVTAAERLGLARPARNHVPGEGGNPRPSARDDDMASVIAGR